MKKIIGYKQITDGDTLHEDGFEYREDLSDLLADIDSVDGKVWSKWHKLNKRYNGTTILKLGGSLDKIQWRKPIYKVRLG